MKLIYLDKVKFLKGIYQDKIGTYIDENSNNYLISIGDSMNVEIVLVTKFDLKPTIIKI